MKILIGMILTLALSSFSFGQLVKKTSSVELKGYKRFVATAYCLKGSKMANGQYPRNGMIAADLRVLSMNTFVEILNLGKFKVGDTGSAVRGNRVDVYMNNCSDAKRFGRRNVLLKVI